MPEPSFGPGLEVRDVVAGYGPTDVLRGVSLEARPGEVTGVIGPNGSGKTTLVRMATRGLAPRAGLVRLGGIDPYAVPARRAARLVAVVPQEMAPAFSFSVLELVLMGRSPHHSAWGGGGAEDWAVARRAMVRANVQHLADRPIEELSGGERRRVILAQALAQDAPILLLDEPTTHLDLRHVVDLLALVGSLAREEGRTVLTVLHDLNLAASLCDRVVCPVRRPGRGDRHPAGGPHPAPGPRGVRGGGGDRASRSGRPADPGGHPAVRPPEGSAPGPGPRHRGGRTGRDRDATARRARLRASRSVSCTPGTRTRPWPNG